MIIIKRRFIAMILLMLPFTISHAQQGRAANVNVAEAKSTELSPVAWVTGTVVSRNNAEIAAEVSARLLSLVALGEIVNKGDIIAKLDDSFLQLELKEEQANVNNAKAKVKFEKAEVSRKKTLLARKLISNTELEETQSNYGIAKATLAGAKARLAQIEKNIHYSSVLAPFTGIVTKRISNQGEYVNSGSAIVRLVETAHVEASIYTPLTAYQFLKQSDALAIRSPLGTESAPIKSIIPVADSRSHLMEVRLDMSKIDWPIGLNIKAAVTNGEKKEVIAVPRDALVLRRNGTSIFKVDKESKAQQIDVEVGIAAGELVEVIGSIEVGDQIVVRGAERLRPGQNVNIKQNNNLISGKQ